MSTVSITALKDISKHIKELYSEELYGQVDVWVCCAEHLNTIEDLPFEVVRRDLNKDIRFCSTRVLTEFINILNQD